MSLRARCFFFSTHMICLCILCLYHKEYYKAFAPHYTLFDDMFDDMFVHVSGFTICLFISPDYDMFHDRDLDGLRRVQGAKNEAFTTFHDMFHDMFVH